MAVTTLIVDAAPLINQIHGLKQWIYDGSIRIVVPLCTLEDVERQYKASLAAKEAPKESVPKKASGRASRREEQPLFDINPRTTWEFLRREQEKGNARVQFQKDDEEFSPWNNEDQGVVPAPESPREPPSSFADALLRKLNITNSSNSSNPGDESKPKPVSRNSDSESSRTNKKLPKVSRKNIPSNLHSFFSYTLWKIHESENGPHQSITYNVLTEDSRMKDSAEMLGVDVCDWANLKTRIVDESHDEERRSTYGQLEQEFPSQPGHSRALPPREGGKTLPLSECSHTAITPTKSSTHNEANAQPNSSTLRQMQTSEDLESLTNGIEASASKSKDDSDLDSDEEIIVFNPRAKRGSWRPKTPAGASDPSHSRPATASGPEPKTTGSPKPARSPIKSSLKPQSPIFTPGQLYSPAATSADNAPAATAMVPTNGDAQLHPKSPARSPVPAHAKPHSAKPHAAKSKPAQTPTSDDRHKQSEIIIQRQREAIHRQVNAVPKAPPRRVQKEPTDNPTIIDPDAFDRSYVVQPPSQTTDRGGKRRSGLKQKHGPKANAQQAKATHAEPEDEFVLKSGAPRGSMRGRGKLFVP